MPTEKWYLHDATTTDTGTLPGSTCLSLTPTVTATGASTNRVMSTTIGSLQIDVSLTTSATKSLQQNWFRRFVSAPIGVQTWNASSAFEFHGAVQQSNTNSNEQIGVTLILWRPSTGAQVATIVGLAFGVAATTTSEELQNMTTLTSGLAVTSQNGDILVVEIVSENTQGKASAYTNHYFYDGTTEDSTTSNASYLLFPNTVVMATTAFVPRNPGVNFQNPGVL